ncbi:helix-turn-helix domain-containing protein [Pandoraea pnomenusa]|uniref:GlxA family transcriptional regulator n=1 Tax=Pandoraea pnomenusa TaxID=93220 RepID=UPI00333EAB6D
MSRSVVFIAYQGMSLHDIAGPQAVFWAGSRHAQTKGMAEYRCRIASVFGGAVRTVEGTEIHTVALGTVDLSAIDTIVLPGAPFILDVARSERALIEWLTRAVPGVRRVASVRSGAFLLAYAGLLDGQRATTHWTMLSGFREGSPSGAVAPDARIARQPLLWTSAGVATGIDLALAMVETDCGHDVARDTARDLAVPMACSEARPSRQEILTTQSRPVPMFEALHLWVIRNLANEVLSVDVLARQVGMSPRHFARVYKEKTGRTPSMSVEHFRLEAALRLLHDASLSLDSIAIACGLGCEMQMHRKFQRRFGVSPSEYRATLSGEMPAD